MISRDHGTFIIVRPAFVLHDFAKLLFKIPSFPYLAIFPCTFWLLSSSCRWFCSSCKRLSSSCWLCRRSCSSTALLPLHSTDDISGPRPDLTKLIWNGRLMRDGFRKSNVNAEPMESEPSKRPSRFASNALFMFIQKEKKIIKHASITTMTALLKMLKEEKRKKDIRKILHLFVKSNSKWERQSLTSLEVWRTFTALTLCWRFVVWSVLRRGIHHLPLLIVGCIKHTASVLSSSARPQVRHTIPNEMCVRERQTWWGGINGTEGICCGLCKKHWLLI